jgi:hypothetical protein
VKTIIYSSVSPTVPDEETVLSILRTARANNQTNGIRGILLLADRLYMQLLEGPADAVDRLMVSICRDPRHGCIVSWLVDDGPDETPMFADWTMAFARVGDVADRPGEGLERIEQSSLHAVLAAHAGRPASLILRSFLKANALATWSRPH